MNETYEQVFTPERVIQMQADGIRVPTKEEMTCTKCSDVGICGYAWDLYNTDGECLVMK